MSKIFRETQKIRLPKPRGEEEEFGKAKKGILECPVCNAYYYKKSWHHNLSGMMKKDDIREPEITGRTICGACQMIQAKLFEGKIIIENVPTKFRDELINLVRAFCKRAYEKDPEDRLIKIQKSEKQFTVTTTENQLAAKLAKKIRAVFNKVDLSIFYPKEPSDVEIIQIKFRNDF